MSIRFRSQTPQGWHIDSRVEPFRFPGGEWHLRLPKNETPTAAIMHGADADDLIVLSLWSDWAHSEGVEPTLFLPYLPAARADRGVPFGAKVYADIINAAGFAEVVVFDPHSPVAPTLIENVRIVDSAPVIRNAIFGRSGLTGDYAAIIAPDKGAVERASRTADLLGLPLLTATKSRDFATGKLTGFHAPEGVPESGRLLIVDDICDGGGTFMGLAEALNVGRERLSLWVSHGIFSGRANLLTEHFGAIYTTDSHPGARREDVGAHVVSIDSYLRVV